ncbi:MAG TPA: ABC transporter substrate-binding protein [Candidatus Bathyarchaeia archaeon]|nr:ABC transporter substrate-binding protein [Candidatus Bathyarchaeia archaeon]
MKVNKVKTTALVGVILTLFVVSAFATQPKATKAIDPFFTLVAKTNGGGTRPDYLNFLRQHLARIGIDVSVIIQDWPTFVGELIAFRDFDICYVGLQGGGADPDFTGVYDENGSLNLFGYDTSMDWDDDLNTGLNEWYMKQGTLIMPPDSEERVQHYWDWEQYMMDKINPLLPTFAPKAYISQWSNLKGYNYTDGIRQSFGKMYYDGSHTGQLTTDELVITDAAWSDLNPLFQDDTSSSYISSAVLDTLIWYDADLSAWPNLADSYSYLNDTTIEISVRDGIKWAPGPDAMTGYELDIKDVYFTFYAWKTVSNDIHLWDWIEDMEIIDDYTMKIYVDADSSTAGNQAYAPSLPALATRILPEHYLNQSQLGDGVTPDVSHPAWNTYATNAFGTGPFEISDFTEGVETVLTMRTDYWGLDETITDDTALDWLNRWGFGTAYDANGLTQQRIRIIPDRQTAILEFEAGKVDIEGVTDFPDKRDEMMTDPDFTIQSDTTFAYGFYGYNMRETRPEVGDRTLSIIDPTLTNGLALRKAMSYAVDRNEINDVVHRGEYTLTDWPIYPKMGIWCNPNIIRYNHDLDKAREYMAIAGFGEYTPTAPGFTLLITLSSIMLVASVAGIIIKKKK